MIDNGTSQYWFTPVRVAPGNIVQFKGEVSININPKTWRDATAHTPKYRPTQQSMRESLLR